MIKDFKDYDIIICDIDNTLIKGWITDLMDWTWEKFQSPEIARILVTLQNKFKLYQVNKELLKRLLDCDTPLYFLTARSKNPNTEEMLNKIFSRRGRVFDLVELGCYNPPKDKAKWIIDNIPRNFNVILFDDNLMTRKACSPYCVVGDANCLEDRCLNI